MSAETESAAADQLELGPVDIVVIGFRPDAPMTGDAIPLFVEKGIIRVFDVMFITKEADGTFSGFDARDLSDRGVGDFTAFEGASSGLLGDDDVASAAEHVEPGTSAVIIVYENRWAAPFIAAVRRNGGELIANMRIGVDDLVAALDAAESAG